MTDNEEGELEVTLAYDVRNWMRCTVDDLTNGEREVLEAGDEIKALALLKEMHRADRLTPVYIDVEEEPDPFASDARTNIIDD